MESVFTPTRPSHSGTRVAANSLPLSLRMWSGTPLRTNRPLSLLKTSSLVSYLPTSIARYSHVNSSTIVSIRMDPLRELRLGVCQEPLQPGVLLVEILQPLPLVHPQSAVLSLPPKVGLRGHTKLPHHVGHGLPLSQPNLSLAELPGDLLRRELLPLWRPRPPSVATTPGFSLRGWSRIRSAGH
jgi:hypothetical protein